MEPGESAIAVADAEWPPLRGEGDWHHSWRWRDILGGKTERFAVVGESEAPLGFWCSAKASPISLPEGRFYRPDHQEIDPRLRGGTLGAFMITLLATRAVELGADGIVLFTFPAPGLLAFYLRNGATQRAPQGWNVPRGLVPFTYDRTVLLQLKEMADGLLES